MRRNSVVRAVVGGATVIAGLVYVRVLSMRNMLHSQAKNRATPDSLIVDRSLGDGRFIALSGGVNFRDIGGYPTRDGRKVRYGRIFRAGELSHLTPDDLTKLQQMGIKVVCDLRTLRESHSKPDKLPDANQGSKIEYWHLPIITDAESRIELRTMLFNLNRLSKVLLDSYMHGFLDAKGATFGQFLRRVADEKQLPTLVHCTAGKDRTGIAIMLLLLALGVPDDIIVADYSLSNVYFQTFRDDLKEIESQLRLFRISLDDLTPLLVAAPDTMRGAIKHVRDRYGSPENYLQQVAGVDQAVIDQLRAVLLE